MTIHAPKPSHCLDVLWRAASPRRLITVSAWADDHRYVSGKQSGERGRWRTSRTPFLREIMDCLSATSRVQDVIVMKSSQVGMTEATVNWLGYILDHAPAPTMVMMPTLESRDAWKTQKLNPLLQETPVIRDLLGGDRRRDASNRQDLIDFPGGVLFLAGGNSPNSYAQKSVANLILDDLDRFPTEVGEEGDVILLAKGRTKAFARAKRVFISTPTIIGRSLIHREWLLSDQRRYHLPCPHCGTYQYLEWGARLDWGLKWNAAVTAAWYICRDCGAEIQEHHKPAMLAAGRWVAEFPEVRTRGYHLSALFAPIGLGPAWLDLARDWQSAVKAPHTLQAFINTNLGEPWEEQGDKIDATGLLGRLEDYPEDYPRLLRSAGVDVQKDRLEATIADWGEGEQCWVLDHLILAGDTARPEVWAQLAEELAELDVEAAAIDSGYNTSMVYAFVEKRSWAYAVKGVPGPGRPLVEDPKVRLQRLRQRRKKGVNVHPVGVDQAKTLLFARLKIHEPGPGYVHFPNDPSFDDEYFAQLSAEKLVTKMRGTRPVAEWVQTRARNEALDCLNYALAALRLSGISLAQRAKDRAERQGKGSAVQTASLLKPPPAPRRPGGFAGNW
jgi:phage terminase large subunit GpA-like protein